MRFGPLSWVWMCMYAYPWFLSDTKAACMGSLGVFRRHHLGCLTRSWWWCDWGSVELWLAREKDNGWRAAPIQQAAQHSLPLVYHFSPASLVWGLKGTRALKGNQWKLSTKTTRFTENEEKGQVFSCIFVPLETFSLQFFKSLVPFFPQFALLPHRRVLQPLSPLKSVFLSLDLILLFGQLPKCRCKWGALQLSTFEREAPSALPVHWQVLWLWLKRQHIGPDQSRICFCTLCRVGVLNSCNLFWKKELKVFLIALKHPVHGLWRQC